MLFKLVLVWRRKKERKMQVIKKDDEEEEKGGKMQVEARIVLVVYW